METFAEFQRRRNASFYSKKAGRIYSSFRTFAKSEKFALANAVEFARRAPRKGKLRVYEVGVGDGAFARNFLKSLQKIDGGAAERTTYVLWDFSERGVERAAGKLGDFAHESIVAPAWGWKRMRDANCVKCNELIDDLPTRMLVRRGARIMEVMRESGGYAELEGRAEEGVCQFMEGMPEGHWIPVPEMGLECLRGWRRRLAPGGWMDVFDYGFSGATDVREAPPHLWNSSIMREFSGQMTVDVNFAFLKEALGGRVEPQKDYVERALGMDLWEVDAGKLDYYSYGEVVKGKKRLEKEGYDMEILLRGGEKSGYLHMETRG